MRVCWAGSFDPAFGRNRRLAEYLEEMSVEYFVVRVEIWPDDRVTGFTRGRARTLIRMLLRYPLLLFRLIIAPRPDLYLVSYPGWVDVPVVKAVAVLKRRPVVFDMFISLHDTAVLDRELVAEAAPLARLALMLDRVSIRLSNRVIADTWAHARFFAEIADVDPTRFGVVFLGADEEVFHPVDVETEDPGLVIFYGTSVPLQGMGTILSAAHLLLEDGIRFKIVGEDAAAWSREIGDDQLHNVEFVGRLPQQELPLEMARAAVCLGIFGASSKADRVVPHKVYEAMACARPVVTGRSKAILETIGTDAVAVCDRADPQDLAKVLRRLLADHREREQLGRTGRVLFQSKFSRVPQAARLLKELKAVNS